MAVADVNGDGRPDLAVANTVDGTVGVLLGKGDGTFKLPASSIYHLRHSAQSVAVADVNNDGRPDIALACVADTLNQGSTGVVTVLINKTKSARLSAETGGR